MQTTDTGWVLGFVLLTLGVCTEARASDGDGEGFGPVIAFSSQRSWSIGWEASITRHGPLAKFSIGGVYHPAPRAEEPYTLHYAAFEPWLIVGGTLGLAVSDGPERFRPVYGVWEGFPIFFRGDVFGGRNVAGEGRRDWMMTFTLGWRGFGSYSQIYFTPKLWRFAPIGLGS